MNLTDRYHNLMRTLTAREIYDHLHDEARAMDHDELAAACVSFILATQALSSPEEVKKEISPEQYRASVMAMAFGGKESRRHLLGLAQAFAVKGFIETHAPDKLEEILSDMRCKGSANVAISAEGRVISTQ